MPKLEPPPTHNVRVFYTEQDKGQVSGPFSWASAQAFAVAAISRPGVVKVTLEPIA